MYMPHRHPSTSVEREVYERRALPMQEMEMFGWTATASAGQLGLLGHSHPEAYEICLIARGHVTWWVNRQVFQLGPGSIFITRPGELHGGTDDVLQPCSLYWMQIELRASQPLTGLGRSQTRDIARGFSNLKHRSFPASAKLIDAFQRLHAELRDRPAHWRIAAQASVHELLIDVLRDHDAASLAARAYGEPTKPIRQSMAFIESHLADNLAVAELARRIGLGVSRFHQRFAAEVGFSPADYRLHLRIRRAKQLLADPANSVTRIAHDLGFSSSQHFATTFKRFVGHTPTAYRARLTDQSSN